MGLIVSERWTGETAGAQDLTVVIGGGDQIERRACRGLGVGVACGGSRRGGDDPAVAGKPLQLVPWAAARGVGSNISSRSASLGIAVGTADCGAG